MGKYEIQRLFLTSFGFNMREIKYLVSKLYPESCFVVILGTCLVIQSPAAFAILIILCLVTAEYVSKQLNLPPHSCKEWIRKDLLLYLQFTTRKRYKKLTVGHFQDVSASVKITEIGFHPIFWAFSPLFVVYSAEQKKQLCGCCRAESCEWELPRGNGGCRQCTSWHMFLFKCVGWSLVQAVNAFLIRPLISLQQ